MLIFVKEGVSEVIIRKERAFKLTYDLSKFIQFTYEIEKMGYSNDLVVSIQPNFIARPKNLISDMIEMCLEKGFDTVIPVSNEFGVTWQEMKGKKNF